MSLGALAFLNPWLLAAMASLPLIYWLLRTIPPRPRQIEFPATRILVGIENREKTPAKTPWWLLLIRLLAAALVILALAEPVLNPSRETALKGTGPVVVVVDNGWASGPRWAERQTIVGRFIDEAESQNRPVVILATANGAKGATARLEAPAEARTAAAALMPQPFAPDRTTALNALKTALGTPPATGTSIVWLTDGIDHKSESQAFGEALAEIAGGSTFVVTGEPAGKEAIGVAGFVSDDGKLAAKLLRADGPQREGSVHAYSTKGQRLGEVPFKLGPGETVKEVTFELPLELRNQVTRLEIANERSAGAVNLLDARSQWQRVGLISGEAQEQAQPLLAPLYYIEKAIHQFSEIIRPKDQNLAQGIDTVLKQGASVLMLADIGTLTGEIADNVESWVEKGGVLVRFAGPRLEKGGDDLLPVPLRLGGRTLGGALSWSTPQPLAPFDETSLFAGLAVPADVTINRQVLADPARLGPEIKVWARLNDGTPLVTATKRGEGQIVLFHVTANSDWSNLPISGLFVDMLRRITTLGGLVPVASAEGETVADQAATSAAPDQPQVLAPVQTLDGYGILHPPPPTAQAIPAKEIATATASLDHPPGYYGPAGAPRSVNVLTPASVLMPIPALPTGAERRGFESESSVPLKPWLLSAALILIFLDIIAVLLLQAGAGLWRRMKPAASTAAVLLVLLIPDARAQFWDERDQTLPRTLPQKPPARAPVDLSTPDAVAQKATEKVTLGYVLTGDPQTDQISRLGLSGLCRVLAVRTAVEPGEPMGVDILKDEIAFYPVLYWPVVQNPKQLPDTALAKIDAYMKQGGMIIFDTRDYSSGLPSGVPLTGTTGPALQRLIGKLDLPRLDPVPADHVLTKSFYLLQSFPGRWDGGQLWVEAEEADDDGGRRARRSDGVTSILITQNDFAAAWALDDTGRPLYPVAPGGERQREMSLRAGVNIVMHALTGNYKADQVHVPALLERLGQ